jgi:hypothetical protein
MPCTGGLGQLTGHDGLREMERREVLAGPAWREIKVLA